MESKKLPPLKPPKPDVVVAEACEEDLVPSDGLARLAKGSAAAGVGVVVLLKLRLLNASVMPPREDCCWCPVFGDDMDPNEPGACVFCVG